MRKRVTTFYMAIALLALIPAAAFAGDLDSSAEPSSGTTGKMFNLEDIYNRLDTGAEGNLPATAAPEPTAGPTTSTGHTLNDVMGKAPVKDDTNGATAADVPTGKTFWSLTNGEWGLKTGSASGGGGCTVAVPKTGAGDLDTYTLETDEDGHSNMQKGVAWPSPRFSDNGDGTVTDNMTGLMWLQDANFANTAGHDPDSKGEGKMLWASALGFVSKLNSGDFDGTDSGKCSYTDWRLPNVRELHSLIHFGYSNPALSNDAGTGQWTTGADSAFSNVQSISYWTNTTYAGYTAYAWYVSLIGGFVLGGDKSFNDYHVWPVRAGQ